MCLFCHSDLFWLIFEIYIHIPDIFLQMNGLFSAAWPTNPERHWLLGATEYLGCCILGPITGSCRNAPARACAAISVAHADLSAYGIWISGRAMQRDAQPSLAGLIYI